jgi:hypothetical protein
MKKTFKYLSMFCLAGLLTASFASCSDDNDGNDDSSTALSEGDKYLQQVLANNVDKTINPTYAAMAIAANDLYEQVQTIHTASKTGTVTQDMVDQACDYWKEARQRYEKSEAFLLGAASDYDIDPHIDTWPLDLQTLYNTLSNETLIKSYDTEDKDANAAKANSDLGQSVLGFHGLEFILFRDGQPRKAAELNGTDSYNQNGMDFTNFTGEYELIYAEAVAGDLRNSIYRLEVCWNENAPQSHVDVLDALEWNTKMSNSDQSYGQNMKNAGQPGSLYSSVKSACSAVLVGDGGASGISDEVGMTKISNPYTGADIYYIESPYSYNSLTDFWDNIQSIANVWYGGVEEDRGTVSFSAYFKKYSPETGQQVEDAITAAQAAIEDIPAPFVLNYTSPKCAVAIDACKTLSSALSEANDFIISTKE